MEKEKQGLVEVSEKMQKRNEGLKDEVCELQGIINAQIPKQFKDFSQQESPAMYDSATQPTTVNSVSPIFNLSLLATTPKQKGALSIDEIHDVVDQLKSKDAVDPEDVQALLGLSLIHI